jgi:hypothetical protein
MCEYLRTDIALVLCILFCALGVGVGIALHATYHG